MAERIVKVILTGLFVGLFFFAAAEFREVTGGGLGGILAAIQKSLGLGPIGWGAVGFVTGTVGMAFHEMIDGEQD